MAGLLALGVGLPALIALLSGAMGIGHNDDFSYAKTAQSLYRTGQLTFDGWAGMTLISQVVLAQPFLWISGGATWGLDLFGLTCSGIALLTSYLLARRILGVWKSLAAAASLLLVPGYLRSSVSFMTDIPALAFTFVALVLCVELIERRFDSRWLAASLAVAAIAAGIREFALAGTGAILLVTWAVAWPARWRTALVATIAAAVGNAVVVLGAYALRGGASGLADLHGPGIDVAILWPALATLGAMLAPLLAIVGTARVRVAIGVVAGLLLVVAVPSIEPRAFLGNLWYQAGMLGELIRGQRPLLFGNDFWAATLWVGTAGAIVLVVWTAVSLWSIVPRIVRGPAAFAHDATAMLGTPFGVIVAFAITYGGGIAAYLVFKAGFDRYLFPLVPIVAILALDWIPERSARGRLVEIAAGTAGVAFLLVAAGFLALNAFAFDAARWRLAGLAMARGYPATAVDAGFDWVGTHAVGPAVGGGTGLTWYGYFWASSSACAVLSEGPVNLPDSRVLVIETVAYRELLFAGLEEPLYLYASNAQGCPQPAGQ
jgi:hypothetical protein